MTSIAGKQYTTNNLKLAYVSGVNFLVGGDLIQLPSVAKNISDASCGGISTYDMSRAYFSNAYCLGGASLSATSLNVSDIAITGLSNKLSSITTATLKASENIGQSIIRYDSMSAIKKNISSYSAGLGDVSSTATKKWCGNTNGTPFVIDQNFIS